MKYLLLAFKSRNSNFEFKKLLSNRGIGSQSINTPKSISSSCTLSLKIDMIYYQQVLGLLRLRKIDGIIGLFLVEKIGLREQTQRLY